MRSAVVQLKEVAVGGNVASWRRLGLQIEDSRGLASGVAIDIHDDQEGLLSCSFSHDQTADNQSGFDVIDGLSIRLHHHSHSRPLPAFELSSTFDGVDFIGIDHIVITTDDLDRTSDAIENVLGVSRARTRDAGHSVTQAFHKLDNTILELVTGPHVKHLGAKWWGFVLTVNDIDHWWKQVGESVAMPPRDAVQQGRKISTIHSSVGLDVAVAVMSPHIRTN